MDATNVDNLYHEPAVSMRNGVTDARAAATVQVTPSARFRLSMRYGGKSIAWPSLTLGNKKSSWASGRPRFDSRSNPEVAPVCRDVAGVGAIKRIYSSLDTRLAASRCGANASWPRNR